MDVAPFVEGGRVYVPVRYLAYALGVPEDGVVWNPSAKTVTLRKDGIIVSLAVGGTVMYVNGRPQRIDAAPLIKGRPRVHVRPVCRRSLRIPCWLGSLDAGGGH